MDFTPRLESGPMSTAKPLDKAIDLLGLGSLAVAINVSPQRLHHWRSRGLPRTELMGQTDYAAAIQRATKRKVKKADLLQWSFPRLNRKAA